MQTELTLLYEAERQRLAGPLDCAQDGDRRHPVFGVGPEQPALMLIGEAPGREEAAAGLPFVGKAGKQLNELLTKACIDRGTVYVTNAVKYRPTWASARGCANRTPLPEEIRAGLPLLECEIRILKPTWIATLGNTPLWAVLQLAGAERESIGSLHGTPRRVEICGRRIWLYPLYHPASAIYNKSLLPLMEKDLQGLGLWINGKENER